MWAGSGCGSGQGVRPVVVVVGGGDRERVEEEEGDLFTGDATKLSKIFTNTTPFFVQKMPLIFVLKSNLPLCPG